MPMNFYELRDHIKNKTPFLVYGDVCRYDPAIHTGDPHEWYRTALRRAEIAVNIEDEAQYWRKQNKLREQVDDLQRALESVRAENARLLAECEAAEKLIHALRYAVVGKITLSQDGYNDLSVVFPAYEQARAARETGTML